MTRLHSGPAYSSPALLTLLSCFLSSPYHALSYPSLCNRLTVSTLFFLFFTLTTSLRQPRPRRHPPGAFIPSTAASLVPLCLASAFTCTVHRLRRPLGKRGRCSLPCSSWLTRTGSQWKDNSINQLSEAFLKISFVFFSVGD